MARKGVPDALVVKVCREIHNLRVRGIKSDPLLHSLPFAHDVLSMHTGEPPKVCLRAMERAADRGLIEYGGNVIGSWPTEKGLALLGAPNGR